MAEQFWKEGQHRVNPESGGQLRADADVSYVLSSAEALKSLSKSLLHYRSFDNVTSIYSSQLNPITA